MQAQCISFISDCVDKLKVDKRDCEMPVAYGWDKNWYILIKNTKASLLYQ